MLALRGVFIGLIRLIDEAGDSPFVRTVFECPGCGREYYADEMVSGIPYYCPECLTGSLTMASML